MTFGEKLRSARKAKGYTQRELAARIDARHNSVSNWENDQNKPDSDTIELLCRVLDLSPNQLFCPERAFASEMVLSSESYLYAPETLSREELLLISSFRNLDAHGRELLLLVAKKEEERLSPPPEKVCPKSEASALTPVARGNGSERPLQITLFDLESAPGLQEGDDF